ncbi:hypothetical protein MSG28_009839 [Choristoneura fumiferana]|uniref:Uncharacterized protein n=1 Tax=Choristoneura fumiferana TaxID=7141 RepID=A0ACC0JCT4_CHOFU|nr:hypothetical protein MSG28_009839 [Choristoneura fumiferana]
MDPFIIAAILSAIVIVVLSITFLRVFQVKPQTAGGARPVPQRDGGPGRVQAVRNQRARMRANARNQAAFEEEEPGVAEEADEEGGQDAQKIDFDDKMGAKKRAKLEAKMEKKKAREAEEQMREMKKKKNEELEEERKKAEEKLEVNISSHARTNTAARAATEELRAHVRRMLRRGGEGGGELALPRAQSAEEERKREEAARKAEEERKKREQEEYEALRAAFTVEGEGFDEEEQEGDSLLKDFVDYIKAQKVVLLEDLAAHFKLKTQAAIDRITDLQASGELTGVIDDRGKFIFISQKELEDVAKFIKQRGRLQDIRLGGIGINSGMVFMEKSVYSGFNLHSQMSPEQILPISLACSNCAWGAPVWLRVSAREWWIRRAIDDNNAPIGFWWIEV